MGPRTALVLTVATLGIPAAAHAQATSAAPAAPPANAAQGTSSAVALPPQNYGANPGFFRSAPEMAAFERADAGVLPATPVTQPAAVQPVSAPAPAAAPAPVPAAASAAVPAQRVPDPTQNLQWAEQQMDRAEATAVQQRQLNTTPAPVAPGAYNGSTDPNDR